MNDKAILFDVDGTLVDSNDLHARAWVDAFAEFGLEIPIADVRQQIGKGADNLMPALLDERTVSRHGAAISSARTRIYGERYAMRVEPFADVAALFRRAKRDGWLIVIATSGTRAEIDPLLDKLGCRDLVDLVTTTDDAEHSKPDPDIFSAALTKIGLQAPNALVVGDSPYDIEAAARIELRAVAVRSGGFSDETLRKAGAVAIYDDVASLLAAYDRSPLATGA